MKYKVWYMRPEFFRDGILGVEWLKERGKMLTLNTLTKTHIELGDFEATDLEDLFMKMQGEVWSPNGEAQPLIKAKGLRHTSMSVGDVAVEFNLGFLTGYIVDNFGWVEFPLGARGEKHF
jgi:hypothetical protein